MQIPLARAAALAVLSLGSLFLSACSSTRLDYSFYRSEMVDEFLKLDEDRAVMIVDLDDTVVDGNWWNSFWLVLGFWYDSTLPLPAAPEALRELSSHYHVVFVTARDDSVACTTLSWLDHHDFPRAPVVFSSTWISTDQAKEDYKASAIAALGAMGLSPRVGIGDKQSDMEAYRRNRLRSTLILEAPDDEDYPPHLRSMSVPLYRVLDSWNEAWKHIEGYRESPASSTEDGERRVRPEL